MAQRPAAPTDAKLARLPFATTASLAPPTRATTQPMLAYPPPTTTSADAAKPAIHKQADAAISAPSPRAKAKSTRAAIASITTATAKSIHKIANASDLAITPKTASTAVFPDKTIHLASPIVTSIKIPAPAMTIATGATNATRSPSLPITHRKAANANTTQALAFRVMAAHAPKHS